MEMSKKVILLLFFSFTLHSLFSQNFSPIFKNYTDELASSEVHDVFQDSTGYMWFATDRGITRFDGESFIHINTQSYFTSSVFNFFEESKTKIWINTGDNELFWFNPNDNNYKFTAYKYNQELVSTIDQIPSKEHIRMLKMDGDNCLVSFLHGPGYVHVSKEGIGEIHCRIAAPKNHRTYSNLYISVGQNFIYSEYKIDTLKKKQLFLSLENKQSSDLVTSNFNFNHFDFTGIPDYIFNNGATYIILGKYLIKIQNKNFRACELPSEGLKLAIHNENVLIATFHGVFEVNPQLQIKRQFLTEYSVTSILEDQEGSFWFSTIESGVFQSKNLKIDKLKESENYNPTSIILKSDVLSIINNNNTLITYSKNGDFLETHNDVYRKKEVISSSHDDLGDYFDCYIDISKCSDLRYWYYPNDFKGKKYYAARKSIHIFNNKEWIQTIDIPNLPHLNDCYQVNDSILLLSSIKGLYNYNMNQGKFSSFQNKIDSTTQYGFITPFKYGILIPTNKGILVIKDNNINLINKNKLLDNQINGIHLQNDTTAWVFTHKGINKLIFTNKSVSIQGLTTKNGLPSNEVISLTSDSTHLWIGTKKGICKLKFDYNIPSKRIKSKSFLIDSVLVNNTFYPYHDTINIAYDAKLSVFFKHITYLENKPIQFEYQIDTSTWILTSPNSITIQNEKPGVHILNIRPKKEIGNIIFTSTIIISPHFSELIWFRAMSFITILIIILFGFRILIRFKDRKKEAELEKLNLELKLLTSQMNPHFTFNTINSIQHYILKNDKNEAIKYLSDFALLIRKTLEFSFNDSITIDEEINFLNLYLKLENKRFENNFVIELSIHEKIDTKTTKIPSFLLQPLIENVILHAKYWEDQERKITISIYDFEGYLVIKIIDYGIGTSNKNTLHKHALNKTTLNKHKSYGLKIIQSRLKIYNGKNYKPNDLSSASTNKETHTGNTTTIKLYKDEYNYS